ncbi:hypothetical protein V2J09_012012 [Rumex salicifolius]
MTACPMLMVARAMAMKRGLAKPFEFKTVAKPEPKAQAVEINRSQKSRVDIACHSLRAMKRGEESRNRRKTSIKMCDHSCKIQRDINLHHPNSSATETPKVVNSGDHIGGVEERHGMASEKHEKADDSNRRLSDCAGDSEPDEEVSEEALDRAGNDDQLRAAEEVVPRAAVHSECVEESGEDAEVSAEVFEKSDGVECGLRVALGGFEDGGIDSEGGRGAAR